jgi:ribosomal protein S18 acetylase RimI-like enzyme
MELDLSALSERVKLPDGMRVQPWSEAHAPALAEVVFLAYQQTDEPRWSRELRARETCAFMAQIKPADRRWSWVLVRASEAVGMVHGAVPKGGRQGYVDNVCVHPALERGGGRALLLTSAWSFRRDGLQRMRLDVTSSNTRAIRLYESIGFVDREWYLELTKP